MRGPDQDLTASERSLRSLERSRHRRAAAPQVRRKVAARKRRAGVMAATILAGSGGSLAIAGLPGPRPSQPGGASASADMALGDVGQRDLRLGSTGAAVTVLERRLLELGYAVEVDRYFDSGTHRAVRRFQRSERLRPDGIVGPATWRALFPPRAGATPEHRGMTLPSGGGSADEEARTRFAVRMAGAGELSSEERRRLGVGGPSLRPEGEGEEGALIAIEFENGTAPEAGSSASEAGSARTGAARNSADVRSTVDRPASEGQPGPPAASPSHQSEGTGLSRRGPDAARPEQPPAPARSGASVCGSERMIAPVAGATFTSSYRSAHRPSHAGIDLAAPSGTPIRSVACGVVSFLAGTAHTGGYGNYICVKHSTRLTTCYAHLSRFSNERIGDQVRRGEVIGYVGSTGHSTGPHLHFEVRSANPYGRNDVDPAPYLAGRPISGTRVAPSAIGGPDLASMPQQQPSKRPTAGAPRASGTLDAPAVDSSTSTLSERSPERMGEASATATTETTPAAAASDEPSSERRAMGSPPGLADTESSDDPSPGGGRDLREPETSSNLSEAAPGQSTASATTDGRDGSDAPGVETQEPTDETEETTEDGASPETPSSDDGEGLKAGGGTAASGPAEEGDASVPAPGARVPFSGPQATPFGGVDALLPLGLTPGVDSNLAMLPSPVTPGDQEAQALGKNAVAPELLTEPQGG